MICFKCQHHNDATVSYCKACGTKLDMTFDQIQQKFGSDISHEKTKETEEFTQWILTVACVIFITGWLFNSMWSEPPEYDEGVGYVPEDTFIIAPITVDDPAKLERIK